MDRVVGPNHRQKSIDSHPQGIEVENKQTTHCHPINLQKTSRTQLRTVQTVQPQLRCLPQISRNSQITHTQLDQQIERDTRDRIVEGADRGVEGCGGSVCSAVSRN